ncbi:MAG: hypothetical protein H9882_05325 [Candidatus Fournierella pullistercoris]|uniref:Uncharacterized protein n=1 Tax=Candidatus Allofournierella pullistercoris TaxID=2838597 RepID=A0A948T2R9_9FIRM|nr:hypothetical protein [Candidatus Fournierella pullistercoris]
MNYTKEQLDELWIKSRRRYETLIAEYRRTHKVPSRGIISTPEIDAERAEQKRLRKEYFKLKDKNEL